MEDHTHPAPDLRVLQHLFRCHLWVQILFNQGLTPEGLMNLAIAHLNQGQRALMGEHQVQVRWIRDQLRQYASIRTNVIKAADVHIVNDDRLTNAGDLFLLGDNVGVPRQRRVIGLNTHANLSLLCGARTWLADATFSVSPSSFNQFRMIHTQVVHKTLPLAFFLMESRTIPEYDIALNMLRAGLDPLPAH